jgi:hypothetical protein
MREVRVLISDGGMKDRGTAWGASATPSIEGVVVIGPEPEGV